MKPQPKPRPKLLDKRAIVKELAVLDRKQRARCRARSGGRCEVWWSDYLGPLAVSFAGRCANHATENHHLLGGIGRRNRGDSLKAEHRLDVCHDCHAEITGHVLVPCVDAEARTWASSVRFERVR